MELEGVGVTQPQGHTYQVRFKFGKQAYFVVVVRRGEDSEAIADKLATSPSRSRRSASREMKAALSGRRFTFGLPYKSFLRRVCVATSTPAAGEAGAGRA